MGCYQTGGLAVVVGLVIFFVSGLPVVVLSSDADILLEFKAASNITFSSWNAANVSQVCQWPGIRCGPLGRVTEIEIEDGKLQPALVGTVPASLVQLTELRRLRLAGNELYGEFPPQIFQLTKLYEIRLSSNALTIDFPPNISSTIAAITAGSTWIRTPLPEASYHNFATLALSDTHIPCPLPQSFVDFHNRGGRIPNCRLQGSKMWRSDDGLLCGQLSIRNTSCSLTSTIFTPHYFPQDIPTSEVNVTFRVEFSNFTLEFNGSDIYVFAAYERNNGERRAFRREYIVLRVNPLQEEIRSNVSDDEFFHTFDQPRWDTIFWVNSTRLIANLTKTEGIRIQMIFDLKPAPYPQELGKIKFSFAVFNEGYTWKDTTSPFDYRIVLISYTMNYRFAHSTPQRLFLCRPPNAFGSSCSSPRANLTSFPDFSTGEQYIEGTSTLTKMSLRYPTAGTIDGRQLDALVNLAFFVGLHPLPLPVYKWLNIYTKHNVAPNVSSLNLASEQEQTISIPIELSVPKIENALFYDPDVSIVLLFDPDPNDGDRPGAAPIIIDLPAGSNQVAVIVAIVVVVIAVAAGILLFAKFVFPYLRARSGVQPHELDDAEPASDRSRAGRSWRKGATPVA